jgi:hypothetical protein
MNNVAVQEAIWLIDFPCEAFGIVVKVPSKTGNGNSPESMYLPSLVTAIRFLFFWRETSQSPGTLIVDQQTNA